MPRTAPAQRRADFAVTADLCPHVLVRLLGLFAQQARTVESVEAKQRPRSLDIRIRVDGLDEHLAEIIAAKMRSMVRVRTVTLCWRTSAARAAARPGGRAAKAMMAPVAVLAPVGAVRLSPADRGTLAWSSAA